MNNTEADAFRYTTGKWLRADKVRQAERCMVFGFDRLCQKVLESAPGAASVASWRKKEGGFNKVFSMKLDNGATRIARIPYPGVGLPPPLSTASEVATIRFLQQQTDIPIPEILDWSSDAKRSAGCEHIIMEEARGTPLLNVWHQMTTGQKIRCIRPIYGHLKQVQDLSFQAYGSLYFQDQDFSANRVDLGNGFCIGPHCGTRYGVAHRGPFPDLVSFANNIIDIGVSRVVDSDPHKAAPIYHGSRVIHLRLLAAGRDVLTEIAARLENDDVSAPVLYHPDLNMRNLFVSNEDFTVITDIIDWQGASVEPGFWYSDEIPDFATPDDELIFEAHTLCRTALTPKMSAFLKISDSLLRPFSYGCRTWNDGAAAFRDELIQVSRQWKDLGLKNECPYSIPSEAELAKHRHEYNLFVTAQTSKRDVAELLNADKDGWVPTEQYESARVACSQIFHGMLQAVLSSDQNDPEETVKDEQTFRAIWPLDLANDLVATGEGA